MSNFNKLVIKALAKHLNVNSDVDLARELLLEDYYIEELRPLLVNMKFSRDDLVVLSATDTRFFKEILDGEYTRSKDFVLDVFKHMMESEGIRYSYPADLFPYLADSLKDDLNFVLKAIELDGNIAFDDAYIKYYKNNDRIKYYGSELELFKQATDNYFKDHTDELLNSEQTRVENIDYDKTRMDDADAKYRKYRSEYNYSEATPVLLLSLRIRDDMKKEEAKLEFLRSLDTYKTLETGSKPE